MLQLGYGVYQVTKDKCEGCVSDALKVGYRLIDTAPSYFNEEKVGNAMQKAAFPENKFGVQTEAWAPFGEGRGDMFHTPELKIIA